MDRGHSERVFGDMVDGLLVMVEGGAGGGGRLQNGSLAVASQALSYVRYALIAHW
jgi:hypothetical protein